MDPRIAKLLGPMKKQSGASKEALRRLQEHAAANLPEDYLDFLHWCDGTVGDMRPSVDGLAELGASSWVELFSIGEVLEYTESDWSIPKRWRKAMPGYLGIGCCARHAAFINLRSDPSGTGLYAIGYHLIRGDHFPLMYQLGTFADLVEHLSTADLELRGADLRGLDLRNARLLAAQLDEASLIGADLTGADLRNACVIGADFTDARLANIRLGGALYEPHTRWPGGFDPKQHGAQLTWDEEAYGGEWPKSYEEFYRSLGRT